MKPGRLIVLFALLQGIIAFLRDGNFTHEESMWYYIGRNWFQWGLTPYEGGVDNKSPLIFAVFGLSDSLFGLNFWFPRLLGIIVQSIGIYFLYKIAVLLISPVARAGITSSSSPTGEHGMPPPHSGPDARKAGIITITIYGLSLLWRATGGKYVSFTETYAITFLLIAVYYYLRGVQVMPANAESMGTNNQRRHTYVSGLMAGIALGWRLSAAFGILAILIHSFVRRRAAVMPFVAGILSALVVLSVLLIIAGISLQDIYLYAFAGNFGAGSTTDHSLGWKLENFVTSFFYSELLLFYPFVAFYFLTRKRFGLHSGAASLLAIWLVCEFTGINVPGIYARPHFKHLLPVMSLMSGILIAHFIEAYRISIKHTLIAVWVLFIPKVTEPVWVLKKKVLEQGGLQQSACLPPYPRANEHEEKLLGQWIRQHTRENDRLLVAGFGARVQLYSRRLSPTVYFNVTQTARAKQRFMQEVTANKPAMIAVPVFPEYEVHVQEDLRRFIGSLVAAEYEKVECLYGYSIYSKRRSLPRPQAFRN